MRIHYPCNLPRALPAATSHYSLLSTASAPMPPQAYTLYIQASMHACIFTGLQATQCKRAGCTRGALGAGTRLVRQTTAAVSVRADCSCIPGTHGHAFQVLSAAAPMNSSVPPQLQPCGPVRPTDRCTVRFRCAIPHIIAAAHMPPHGTVAQAMRRSARRRDAAFAIAHSWAQIPLTVTSALQMCGM